MSRLSPAVFSVLFASGCCDCVFDSVRVEIADAAGEPAAVDALRLTWDGGTPSEQGCQNEAGLCEVFLVPTPDEGSLRIEALLDDDVVGSLDVEVIMAPARPGQCCSGGFKEDRVLTVVPPG